MLPHEEHAAHQGSGSAHSRGRKLQDIAQKARGRTPLKYEFTIIPFFCGKLRTTHQLCAEALCTLGSRCVHVRVVVCKCAAPADAPVVKHGLMHACRASS